MSPLDPSTPALALSILGALAPAALFGRGKRRAATDELNRSWAGFAAKAGLAFQPGQKGLPKASGFFRGAPLSLWAEPGRGGVETRVHLALVLPPGLELSLSAAPGEALEEPRQRDAQPDSPRRRLEDRLRRALDSISAPEPGQGSRRGSLGRDGVRLELGWLVADEGELGRLAEAAWELADAATDLAYRAR